MVVLFSGKTVVKMLCGACAVRSVVRSGGSVRAVRWFCEQTSGDRPGGGWDRPGGDWSRRVSSPEESPLRRLVRGARAGGFVANPGRDWHTTPYTLPERGEEEPAREAPHETSVLLFPGQGSQYVGMGLKVKDVPAARELYDLASNILGWDVWGVCTSGPESELRDRAQECVVVSSLAALEAARESRSAAVERVRAAAGYSAGQFAALVFAGALTFEDALRVLSVRAAAMRACAAERPGGMLAVWAPPGMNVTRWAADAAAAAGGSAWVAARLYPGCRVVAADAAGLAALEAGAKAAGLRRTQRLAVTGPWHCSLMAATVAPVRAALNAVEVQAPRLTVVCSASLHRLRTPLHVKLSLASLAAKSLNWEGTLHALYARPRSLAQPLTLALGPGNSMRSMLRLVNARGWDCSVQIDV